MIVIQFFSIKIVQQSFFSGPIDETDFYKLFSCMDVKSGCQMIEKIF